MLNRLIVTVAAALTVSTAVPLMAADSAKATAADQKQIEATAAAVFSRIGGRVKSIKPAPVDGLYEILIEKDGKSGIVYLDRSGRHLMQGMVLDAATLTPVFAHPEDMLQPKQQTSLDVKRIPAQHAVVMGNPKGTRKLYVFTDPDCPYCSRMHTELKKLEKAAPDLAILVMLMPLESLHPGVSEKVRAVMENGSLELLDKAFTGKQLPKPKREESRAAVEAILKFAGENGINGTPTLVLDNGSIMVGMRDAETLKGML